MKIGKYQLMKTTVKLRGGKTQTVYFFASTQPHGASKLTTKESTRRQTIGDEKVARALVQLLGFSIEHAATAASEHKAYVEGLTEAETDRIRSEILRALRQEEQP